MKIGYARVSSKEQNLARQIKALEEAGCEKIYMDKQSGKNFEREQYQKMISKLTKEDILLVLSIDRLGRNYEEIIEQWRNITKEIKANVRVLDMPLLDTTIGHAGSLTDTFIADLVLQILSYVAENERQHIRERQAEGIAIAKANGKYTGRKVTDIDENIFKRHIDDYKNGKISKLKFANLLGVSRTKLERVLRERNGF